MKHPDDKDKVRLSPLQCTYNLSA